MTTRYRRPHRAKKKKPFFAKAWFWRSVLLLALLGGGIWFVCFSSVLEVKEVTVAGTQKVDRQDCVDVISAEVTKKIAMFDSKSILLFNLDQAKKDILAQFPQIQSIKIERQFPSRIMAQIEERRAVATFNDGSKVFLLDDQGIAFQEASTSADLLQISDSRATAARPGGTVIGKDVLAAILRMKSQIQSASGILVERAVIATPERINLLTQEGWYIYFNPLKDIESQLTKLEAMISDDSFKAKRANLEYVDIRFTRVYLKEKSQ
jgi:cell division protein FtsQ